MARARAAADRRVSIEIVFFDAGETLVHPHPSFPDLFAQVCNERGRDVSAADVQAVQARLAPHLVDLAEDTGVDKPSLSPDDSKVFWSYLYRRFLRELGLEDEALVESLYAKFSDVSSYALFDDVVQSLERLAGAGYRIGLISNFEGWLDEMLVELEVGDVFETKVISGLVGIEKPDPEIYRLALERAGVAARSAAHVGDSPGLDVAPASSVGIHPILIDRFDRYPSEEVTRIKSLQELPAVVAEL